eukprot:scaffold79618_cov35-Prasinocladus_malaysianus.AAC.1
MITEIELQRALGAPRDGLSERHSPELEVSRRVGRAVASQVDRGRRANVDAHQRRSAGGRRKPSRSPPAHTRPDVEARHHRGLPAGEHVGPQPSRVLRVSGAIDPTHLFRWGLKPADG